MPFLFIIINVRKKEILMVLLLLFTHLLVIFMIIGHGFLGGSIYYGEQGAGVFAFMSSTGKASKDLSFHVVVSS